MTPIKSVLSCLLLLLLPLTAYAGGYLMDSQGQPVRSQYGHCWRTGSWTPAQATYECDPDLADRNAPKAMMAAPIAEFLIGIVIDIGKDLLEEGLKEGIKSALASSHSKTVKFKNTDLFDGQHSGLTPDGKHLLEYVLREVKGNKKVSLTADTPDHATAVTKYLLVHGFTVTQVIVKPDEGVLLGL